MRLAIDPARCWPADIALELEPLAPRPLDEAAWRRDVLRRAGAATAAAAAPPRAAATACGFPVELWASESCLVALYTFLDHVAAAIARAPDPETLAARRDELEALLLGARPDWSGPELACLEQIWERRWTSGFRGRCGAR